MSTVAIPVYSIDVQANPDYYINIDEIIASPNEAVCLGALLTITTLVIDAVIWKLGSSFIEASVNSSVIMLSFIAYASKDVEEGFSIPMIDSLHFTGDFISQVVEDKFVEPFKSFIYSTGDYLYQNTNDCLHIVE